MTAAQTIAEARTALSETRRGMAEAKARIDEGLKAKDIPAAWAARDDFKRLETLAELYERQIKLLGPLVVREESERDNPTSVHAIEKKIAADSLELRTRLAKPRTDRSAHDDTRIDHLRQEIPYQQRRLEQARRMESP